MAIRSIIYLNYEPEPLAFDNTGAPLFREVLLILYYKTLTKNIIIKFLDCNFSCGHIAEAI